MITCSIVDYGASSCDALQTTPIQRAIDACFLAGGGTVRIPQGHWRTGSIRLRSRVTLYLEQGARLEGSQDPEDYHSFMDDTLEPISAAEREAWAEKKGSVDPYSRWNNGLIRAFHATDIAIIGEAFSWIDGMNCYDAQGEDGYRGPHAINLHFCENVTLRGYSIVRSGNWAHALFYTKNVAVEKVTVLAGHDGFDIRSCDNVRIENCHFDTGDDCIAGFDNNDVIVRNCTLGSSCFLFRFGGNNILFENCTSQDGGSFAFRGGLTMEEKARGIWTDETHVHRTGACFMHYCDFRAEIRKPIENIRIRNCEFGDLMTIFSHNWDENYIWCCNRPLRQIKFEGCVFRSVYDSIYIHGSQEEPMLFEMENCDITVTPGYEDIPFLDGVAFGTVVLKNVRLHGYTHPRIVKHTPGTVTLEDCSPIEIVEEDTPEFRGAYRDQVLVTEAGPMVMVYGSVTTDNTTQYHGNTVTLVKNTE